MRKVLIRGKSAYFGKWRISNLRPTLRFSLNSRVYPVIYEQSAYLGCAYYESAQYDFNDNRPDVPNPDSQWFKT